MKYLYYRVTGYIGKILGCEVYKRKNKIVFKSKKDEYLQNILDEFFAPPGVKINKYQQNITFSTLYSNISGIFIVISLQSLL